MNQEGAGATQASRDERQEYYRRRREATDYPPLYTSFVTDDTNPSYLVEITIPHRRQTTPTVATGMTGRTTTTTATTTTATTTTTSYYCYYYYYYHHFNTVNSKPFPLGTSIFERPAGLDEWRILPCQGHL
jgi:hypothetical protein